MRKNKLGGGRPRIAPEVRFWPKIIKTDTCWIWTEYLNPDGYGRFWDGKKRVLAHRFSWESANGPLASGVALDHRCHNRACVRPSHLRPATQSQNQQNLRGAYKNSSTGIRGVHWCATSKRYVARVGVDGKSHYIGRFVDLEEAAERVREARLRLHTHNDLDRIA